MARTDNLWEQITSGVIQPSGNSGANILIKGIDKYVNFNTISGSGGYGFRDNSGVMEFKNNAGAWTPFGSGGGGTPAGTNKQLQFNNAGAFGGALFEYTGTGDNILLSLPDQSVANTIGGSVQQKAGRGKGTGDGGGYVIEAGNDEAGNNFGGVLALGGANALGRGGDNILEGGQGATDGGSTTVRGGTGVAGVGGDLILGGGVGGAGNGRVKVQQSGGTNVVAFDVDALTADHVQALQDADGVIALVAQLAAYQELIEKNNPNGYAGLENHAGGETRLWRNNSWISPEYQIDGIHRRSAPPTVTDDETARYLENDIWVDTTTTTGGVYVCLDQSAGVAVWRKVAVNSGGGGGVTLTDLEIDMGSTPVSSKKFTITDAGVDATKKIIVYTSPTQATGRKGDDWELDTATFSALAGAGGFTLSVLSPFKMVGARSLYYQVV